MLAVAVLMETIVDPVVISAAAQAGIVVVLLHRVTEPFE
tara:strand:- start:265 stop:381 length:117 start_codon:yes stop_codon:yes gene_type:complete